MGQGTFGISVAIVSYWPCYDMEDVEVNGVSNHGTVYVIVLLLCLEKSWRGVGGRGLKKGSWV